MIARVFLGNLEDYDPLFWILYLVDESGSLDLYGIAYGFKAYEISKLSISK